MKSEFTLPQFPNATFVIETSVWTGKSKIWKDGDLYERSSGKGKPFIIPSESGELYKIYPKQSFPDTIPALEIDGIKYDTVEKLPWYQYALAALPLILLILGGGLGGAIGAFASMYNLNTFRTQDSDTAKYVKVIAASVLAYLLYLLIGYLLLNHIN